MKDCGLLFFAGGGPCHEDKQPIIDAKMPAMKDGVAKVLQGIRAVMKASGRANKSYRLILQAPPPPPVPAA